MEENKENKGTTATKETEDKLSIGVIEKLLSIFKPAEAPKDVPKEAPKEEPKEQPKEEPKEQPKEQPKEESKEDDKPVTRKEIAQMLELLKTAQKPTEQSKITTGLPVTGGQSEPVDPVIDAFLKRNPNLKNKI